AFWEHERTKASTRCFTRDMFKRYRKALPHLEEYVRAQLIGLGTQWSVWEKTGLLLDVLEFHVTADNTAAETTSRERADRYAWMAEDGRNEGFTHAQLEMLIEELKSKFLLTDGSAGGVRLAHDTLGPIIKKIFAE